MVAVSEVVAEVVIRAIMTPVHQKKLLVSNCFQSVQESMYLSHFSIVIITFCATLADCLLLAPVI